MPQISNFLPGSSILLTFTSWFAQKNKVELMTPFEGATYSSGLKAISISDNLTTGQGETAGPCYSQNSEYWKGGVDSHEGFSTIDVLF